MRQECLISASFIALVLLLQASGGAQERSRPRAPKSRSLDMARLARHGATLDLASGTITRNPAPRSRRGMTTSVTFANLDVTGFYGQDTGGGVCEWIDAGVKSAEASQLMTGFTTAYCSSAVDPRFGGPGGSFEISFYEGYTAGGSGGAPNGTEVARFCLSGLPSNSATPGALECRFLGVRFPDFPVCFADGPVGYGWKFTDVDAGGILAATSPVLACVQSCAGPGPDALGMIDSLDQYSPPGTFHRSFTLGMGTAGHYTSIALSILEESGTAFTELDEGKPNKKNCRLACDGKPNLLDKEFSAALKKELGNSFHSLIVEVDSCYGGGFLIELKKTFDNAKNTRPVFGASASPWNKTAWSERYLKGDEQVKHACVWAKACWTPPRHTGVENGASKNKKEILEWFSAQERVPTNPSPQCVEIKGGGDVKLGGGTDGSGATKLKALLIGGPDAVLWNTVAFVRKGVLRSGYAEGDITVLFGDGKAPKNAETPDNAFTIDGRASQEKILQEIEKLMTAQEYFDAAKDKQIFILLATHGGVSSACSKLVRPSDTAICGNTLIPEPFLPFEVAALTSADNLSGPLLDLRVAGTCHAAIDSGYRVFLNDVELAGGSIPGGANAVALEVAVPPGLVLASGNEISIRNTNPGARPILVEAFLSPGDMDFPGSITVEPRDVRRPGR